MIKKFLVFQLFTYLLCFIQTTYAQDSDNKVQVKKSIWAAGNYFILNVDIPPSYKEKITLVIHNRNNFSSQLEGIEKGSLKLLDGKILITQGINTPDQFMIDRLDTVSLFTKLAIDLLDIAVPEGLQLKTTKQINIVEKDRTLMVGTLSASMKLPTPWELTGTVAPLNNNTIDFDFKLHSQDQHISIKGSWEKRTPCSSNGRQYASNGLESLYFGSYRV